MGTCLEDVPADLLEKGHWAIKAHKDTWIADQKIAVGGFGAVYKGHHERNASELVAIKTEKKKNKNYIEKEAEIYKHLKNSKGFPSLKWTGKVNYPTCLEDVGNSSKTCRVMVTDLLGQSLSDLFYKNNKCFSLKTTLMLADQMIERLQELHSRNVVHRDIKPGNFVMGRGKDAAVVYLIDFGLAHMFRDTNNKHIPYQCNVPFRGTHRYASMNAHFKIEQTRRDDLESLGYVLIYLKNGLLPWQNIVVPRHKRREVIGKQKKTLSIDQITANMPYEFARYMNYCRKLRYDEEPDYDKLRLWFRQCYEANHFSNDNLFDWSPTPTQYSQQPQQQFTQYPPTQFTLTHFNHVSPQLSQGTHYLPQHFASPRTGFTFLATDMDSLQQLAMRGAQKRKAQLLEDATRTKRAKLSHTTQKRTNENDEEVSVVVISSEDN